MRAILYCRVSSDPRQHGKSVSEQETECRAVATRNGWNIGEVLVDNDRGASRYSRKDRPAYRRLAEILAAGDVLVTWEASRAQRDLKAYLQLRDLCAEREVLWCYSGKVHDLTAGDDRFTTGLDALIAEREVEMSRDRVLRAARANAAAGRPHGKPAYGYRIVRDPDTGQPVDRVPDPVAAPVVREILTRVLSGDSVYAITTDLTARRIPAPHQPRDAEPEPWGRTTVRRIAANPTYAGLRTHHGKIVGPGTWEALITPDEHQRIVAMLNDPSRLKHRGNAPRWLLSGIGVCGVCGATVRRLKGHGRDIYVCRVGGCTSRPVDLLDAYVEELVLRRLESQDFAASLEVTDDAYAAAVEDARALRQRLDGFTDSAAEGELSPAALARIEAKLRPKIEAADARVRALVASPHVARMSGFGARERWKLLTVRDRRELVQTIVKVEVFPMGRGHTAKSGGDKIALTWL